MRSTLAARGQELTNLESIDFTLEALESLLEDDLDFHATELLREIEQIISQESTNVDKLTRFLGLLARCLKARADVDKLLKVIDASLLNASAHERSRLEAERAELDLLSGNLRRTENVEKENG
jgi:hypothetical protein